jgi:hypothetical protein
MTAKKLGRPIAASRLSRQWPTSSRRNSYALILAIQRKDSRN